MTIYRNKPPTVMTIPHLDVRASVLHVCNNDRQFMDEKLTGHNLIHVCQCEGNRMQSRELVTNP